MFPLSFKTSVGYGFLLLWIIVLHSFLSISTACIEDERSSLLDFKGGLNLSWGQLSSWRGFNCCEWEGVGCDYHTSHVITLDLSYQFIAGIHSEIHPSLFDLQHLQHLDFRATYFGGISIPPQFSNLQRLSFLSLSEAGFSGEVPLEVGNMSSLRYLDLSDNQWRLNGGKFDVWARGLRSLEFLGMDSVNLTMDSERWGEALSGLHNLTEIHLSSCGLSGNIPDLSNLTSFDSLPSLAHLDLSNNQLSGTIPESISKLASLSVLSLSHNHLTGQIPPSLCELSTLSDLHLGYNQLSGTIPDSLLKMASLELLSLASNRLRGNISLQMLDNLTRLLGLDLSENHLSISISASWIPQFDYLEYLLLRSCNIEGAFPAFLSQQYELRALDLSSNYIVGNIPLWLWDLPNLQTLILSDNNLEGSLPWQISHLFSMVDLQGNRLYGTLPTLNFVSCILHLSDNKFNGSIPNIRPPSNSPPIFLSLSGNNLSGEIPSSTCTNSDRVGFLDLSNNKLTGMIPATIGSCSQLEVLKLAHNDLEGEIPEELGNLTGLAALNLSGNRFKGNIPPSLSNCTGLQIFDLGNNKFEGKIPAWIEKLKDLQILSLTSNNFEGKIPSQLMRLQYLRILDLSSNCLSESIPQDLSKLYAMINQSQSIDERFNFGYFTYFDLVDSTHESKFEDEVTIWIKGRVQTYQKIIYEDKFMDLSHNNLSGNIPPALGVLQGLISLNFSNNQLCGSIPESMVNMARLESLDLSENKLSGKIPFEFSNLTFLEVLNLSNNMLSGLIPQGKQFATFEASSFLGNPNLHGFPLENTTLGCGSGCREHQAEWNKTTVGSSKDIMESRWWAVGVGLSYGVGFGIVIAVLCFHIKWRNACFHLMDNFIYQLFEG